jgi:hypothetical protein
VFSTEGHPLIIPPKYAKRADTPTSTNWQLERIRRQHIGFCQNTRRELNTAFYSAIASRGDIFHAAKFVRLDRMRPGLPMYPWTLPLHLVPPNATCDPIPSQEVFDLVFPTAQTYNYDSQIPNITRVQGGVLLRSLSNLRVSLLHISKQYRVSSIGTVPLGIDERIYVSRNAVAEFLDLTFGVKWNPYTIKLEFIQSKEDKKVAARASADSVWGQDLRQLIHSSLSQLLKPGSDLPPTPTFDHSKSSSGKLLTAVLAPNSREPIDGESYTYMYSITHNACEQGVKIPAMLAHHLQVLMIPRGGCTFTQKLANVPTDDLPGLKLVLFLDLNLDIQREHELIRPLLDHPTPYTVGMIGGKNLMDINGVLEIVSWREKGVIQVGGVDVINWEVV